MKNLDENTLLNLITRMRMKKVDALHESYDSDVSWDYYGGWHDAIEELQKQIKNIIGDQND